METLEDASHGTGPVIMYGSDPLLGEPAAVTEEENEEVTG